ncbi:MAG: hypothetical protein M0Q91_00395 [Methanoregula sp.]|nr:hypothetical protein [Methanoregula sp.]
MGVVDLVHFIGNRRFVWGIDALEGTPVLDIKPTSVMKGAVWD